MLIYVSLLGLATQLGPMYLAELAPFN